MIATDHYGSFYLPGANQIVNAKPKLRTLSIPKPANSRGQTLKSNSVAGQTNPSPQVVIIREHLENETVGLAYILGISGQSNPAKWPFALAKHGANVFRHKARNFEGVIHARSSLPGFEDYYRNQKPRIRHAATRALPQRASPWTAWIGVCIRQGRAPASATAASSIIPFGT